jgi:hypothetical protein
MYAQLHEATAQQVMTGLVSMRTNRYVKLHHIHTCEVDLEATRSPATVGQTNTAGHSTAGLQ